MPSPDFSAPHLRASAAHCLIQENLDKSIHARVLTTLHALFPRIEPATVQPAAQQPFALPQELAGCTDCLALPSSSDAKTTNFCCVQTLFTTLTMQVLLPALKDTDGAAAQLILCVYCECSMRFDAHTDGEFAAGDSMLASERDLDPDSPHVARLAAALMVFYPANCLLLCSALACAGGLRLCVDSARPSLDRACFETQLRPVQSVSWHSAFRPQFRFQAMENAASHWCVSHIAALAVSAAAHAGVPFLSDELRLGALSVTLVHCTPRRPWFLSASC